MSSHYNEITRSFSGVTSDIAPPSGWEKYQFDCNFSSRDGSIEIRIKVYGKCSNIKLNLKAAVILIVALM